MLGELFKILIRVPDKTQPSQSNQKLRNFIDMHNWEGFFCKIS